jgi:molybdopterin-guanine dinucleotide biosynthesis protein MobB
MTASDSVERAQIPAIVFTGRSNSGKTTLLETLITELTSRGINVGTIKHHSHEGFNIDVPGKDSYRHVQAGSKLTVISAPDKMALVQQYDSEPPLEDVLAQMRRIAAGADANGSARRLDIILVEGYKKSKLPTVELFRAANPKDADRALDTADRDLIAVVTDIPRVVQEARSQGIPSFDFDDTVRLANFLLQ